jgi:hypothetical protein
LTVVNYLFEHPVETTDSRLSQVLNHVLVLVLKVMETWLPVITQVRRLDGKGLATEPGDIRVVRQVLYLPFQPQ